MKNRFHYLKNHIVITGLIFMLFGILQYEILKYFTLLPSLIFVVLFLVSTFYILVLMIQAFKKQVKKRVFFSNLFYLILCLVASSYFARISGDIYWYFAR